MKLSNFSMGSSPIMPSWTNPANRQPRSSSWKTRILGQWQAFVNAFQTSSEMRIWQTRDRQGEEVWNAYDPNTGTSVYNLSEEEMRRWVDQRYHARPEVSL